MLSNLGDLFRLDILLVWKNNGSKILSALVTFAKRDTYLREFGIFFRYASNCI